MSAVRTVDWEARCRLLELRDAERARELTKAHAREEGWRRAADRERKAREEAEANAARFHALLLQERVRKIIATDPTHD
jgi:hypothetical protein